MPQLPFALWINPNPSFSKFHQPLIRYFARQVKIAQWDYYQEADEACSLEIALTLLHDYCKSLSQPIHLVGHGTGGLLGLLYARRYPHKVSSLTLLGVGVNPAVDWQAHYCAIRKLLPCSQNIVLGQMVKKMFGDRDRNITKRLIEILKQDLNTSPSAHSLYRPVSITPGGIPMPLMVCGSQDDLIVDRHTLRGWQTYLKDGDILWECPQGHHFFHYFQPQAVGRQIIKFWQSDRQVDRNQLIQNVLNF